MKIWDIHGGIHPPENKTQSLQDNIRAAHSGQLIVPLSQHIGAPAAPIVNVGDRVLKGQMIGEAKGFVSAPVHAPSPARWPPLNRALSPPSGMSAPCVVINCDGKDEWISHQGIVTTAARQKHPGRHHPQRRYCRVGGAGFQLGKTQWR